MENICREKIRKFLRENATEEKVLNIGAGDVQYREYFPNQDTLDTYQNGQIDIVQDCHKMKIKEKYNVILCSQALEHLYNPQLALDKMWDALKPNGKLILTVPLVYPVHEEPHDYFRYTEYGLRHLLRKWSDVKIIPKTNRFETIGMMVQVYGSSELRVPGVRLLVQTVGKIVSMLPSRTYKYTTGYLITATKK